MSDKLQFVVDKLQFVVARLAETRDKLQFVGLRRRIFIFSGRRLGRQDYPLVLEKRRPGVKIKLRLKRVFPNAA